MNMTPPPTGSYPAESQTSPTAVRGSGCGCLGCVRGCLILVLLLVTCFIVAIIVAQTIARPYIDTQIPKWRAEYPWVSFAIDAYELGRDFLFPSQANATAAILPGKNDKSLLPSFIVVYPDPGEETYSISETQVTGYQRIDKSQDEVVSYFRSTMPQHDWRLLTAIETTEMRLLIWQWDRWNCQTEISSSEQGTGLWLRWSLTASSRSSSVVE